MHGDIRTYLWVPQRPPLEAPKIWAKKETDIGTYLWVPQRPPLEAPKNEADVRIYLWVPQRHRLEAPKMASTKPSYHSHRIVVAD